MHRDGSPRGVLPRRGLAPDFCLGSLRFADDGLAQRRVRSLQILGHLNVRDVERPRDLVEAKLLSILRQQSLHAQQRESEQIAQRGFILDAIHAPHGAAATRLPGDLLLDVNQARAQLTQKRRTPRRRWLLRLLRRHLAHLHTIKQQHEPVQLIAVRFREREPVHAQVPLLHIRVVTLRTVAIEESAGSGTEISRPKSRGA